MEARWKLYLLLGGCISYVVKGYLKALDHFEQDPSVDKKLLETSKANVTAALQSVRDLKPKLAANTISNSDVTEFFERVKPEIMGLMANRNEEYPKKCNCEDFTNMLSAKMKITLNEIKKKTVVLSVRTT